MDPAHAPAHHRRTVGVSILTSAHRLGSTPTVTENQTFVPPLTQDNATFDEISPRVVLTWHPNSTLTLYSSYSEGFRSGFPQDLVRATVACSRSVGVCTYGFAVWVLCA